MDSLQWFEHFHLIRPFWLLALLPLALVVWLYARTQTQNHSWASIIDKRLLQHLLHEPVQHQKKPTPIIGLFGLGFIIIFALAGPAFEKRPQPVFKNQAALVIILDLSRSMDSTDVKPNRLHRAHFKINDIIDLRKEGQTALIAYAANAYVVSPLTDDADTIASQVPALETAIMPAQGSRLDIALEKALQLFKNAGHAKGDILVISDSVNAADMKKIKQLNALNYNTSILAIGTEQGAPITNPDGSFVKDKNGKIVIPQLNLYNMKDAALNGGGKFSLITASDNDIKYLLSSIDGHFNPHDNDAKQADKNSHKFKTDLWHEEGPWLILLILPFAAYAFRKGLIFVLVIFILPLPQPAQAFEWVDLWQNKDQRGEAEMQQGNVEHAADLFNSPEWKAAAQYKAGKYEQSAELLKDINTAEANYNRGNALAKAGEIEKAIEAYERSLKLDPKHEDAEFNKKLLQDSQEDESKKDDTDGENSEDKKEQDKKDSEKDKKNDESQKKDDKSKEGEDKKNKSDKDSESKDDKSEKNDSKQDESKKDGNDEEKQDDKQSKQDNSEKNPDDNKKKENKSQPEPGNDDDDATKDQPKDNELSDEEEKRAPDEEKKEEQYQPKEKEKSGQKNKPDLKQQQTQQWLKKIPDDPGGLLRRKFKYQYSQQKNRNEEKPW